MTPETARLLSRALSSKVSREQPLDKPYDDGMYRLPDNAVAAAAGPPSEPTSQTKPAANADARPKLPGPESASEAAKLQETINEIPAPAEPPSAPLNAQPEPLEGQIPQTDMGTSTATTTTSTLSSPSSATSSTSSFTSSSTSTTTASSTSTTRTTLHTTSLPTTTHSPFPTSSGSLPTSESHTSARMTPGSQAGIVVSILTLAFLLIGLINWRLHHRKRALQTAIHGEKRPPPQNKQNSIYKFASNLYTSSTLTLVNVAEMFKHHSRDSQGSTSGRSSSIYSRQPTPFPILSQGDLLGSCRAGLWKNRAYDAASRVYFTLSSVAHMALEKVKSVPRKQKSATTRRSRESYEYGFSEEYLHIPPPEPAVLRGIVSRLYANGSSALRSITEKFNPQRPPTDNTSLTWCSTSSPSPSPEEYDRNLPAQQFQDSCEVTDNRDLVKVRSVSSGMVAMSNSADISVDALAGRISGEKERHQTQHSPEESLPVQDTSKKNDLSQPQLKLIQSAIQREVSSVKLSTVQVFRVEMAFVPRNDGHMDVSEGQLVRLEQTFDDGWAWCTLVDTGIQGLVPRACLSTWPLKEHRPYTPSSICSDRGPGGMASLSPTDSQSVRFYQRHSPGTSRSGLGSKPPSVK
ncbi:hypothetical protein BDW67DRAFT_188202 [Aspergillus spinulosporus]